MTLLEEQEYNIIDTTWLTTGEGDCLGVVAIKTIGGWKAYIGVGSGVDKELDSHAIAKLGAKLPVTAALAFFPHFAELEYKI